MKKKSNESIIFHGEIINKKEAESQKFPIGTRFHFKNVSYNDEFLVTGIRKDPGTEYRQILGKVAGEVLILLSSFQRESVVGTITYVEEAKAKEQPQISQESVKANKPKKAKINKVVKKKITAKKKSKR